MGLTESNAEELDEACNKICNYAEKEYGLREPQLVLNVHEQKRTTGKPQITLHLEMSSGDTITKNLVANAIKVVIPSLSATITPAFESLLRKIEM